MKQIFTILVALLATTNLWAYDFQYGELYYNITSDTTVKVTYQEYSSPSNYSGLTSATIPETVTYEGRTYSVTSIGGVAFAYCSALTSVTIPNSVTSIGIQAFYDCSSLTSVTIPNSVTSIEYEAFCDCSSLTSVTIGNSVTSIGNYAFEGCSALTSVIIGNSVTSIGYGAFYDCSSLISVTIPNSVTSMGYGAFNGCDALTSMVVESDNNTYDSRENCNAIIETATNTLIAGCQNTIIPNSVTSIGLGAFKGCSALTSITIPYSVTSIGDEAFRGCHSLTSVTIGNSVTSIGEGAFGQCYSIKTVICEAIEVPELGDDVFYDMPLSEATLYIPAQSLDDYKAAEQWKEFGTILPLNKTPSAVENTQLSIANGTKLLRNGQVYILQDGKAYTITGQEL